MVTTSIRHKHQQTTDNTKHRTQNSNWVHNRHKHLHDETHTLPIKEHLQLHASQIRPKSQHPTHPLHYITIPRRKKQTTYNNTDYTRDIDTNDDVKITTNMKHIHTTIVRKYLNKVTNTIPPTVHHFETTLSRATHRTLAQLRTNNIPYYTHTKKIDEDKHPSPLCPLFRSEPHTITHLFNCTNINTHLKNNSQNLLFNETIPLNKLHYDIKANIQMSEY